jgi:hypothetical protein
MQLSITPKQGKPIKGFFTLSLRVTSGDGQTDSMFRVIRDDGKLVWGGNSGAPFNCTDDGDTLTITFFDGVPVDQARTYRLEGRKRRNNQNVQCSFRTGYLEELSKVVFQSYSVNGSTSSDYDGDGEPPPPPPPPPDDPYDPNPDPTLYPDN